MKTNEKTQLFNYTFNCQLSIPSAIPFEDRLAKLREHLAHCNKSVDYPERPIPVTQVKSANSSGYAWRGIELTRQEMLCLLLFSEKATNQHTARLLGTSIQLINACSASLRHKLKLPDKKIMVVAARAAGFSHSIPDVLVDSLFDEVAQKKHQKLKTKRTKL